MHSGNSRMSPRRPPFSSSKWMKVEDSPEISEMVVIFVFCKENKKNEL